MYFNCARYAFLTFGSRPRMLDAFNRYSSRRLVADGQVVHVIKYEPPKTIPYGMYIQRSNECQSCTCFLLVSLPSAFVVSIHSTLPTSPCCQYFLYTTLEHFLSILCLLSLQFDSSVFCLSVCLPFSFLSIKSTTTSRLSLLLCCCSLPLQKYYSYWLVFVIRSALTFILRCSFDSTPYILFQSTFYENVLLDHQPCKIIRIIILCRVQIISRHSYRCIFLYIRVENILIFYSVLVYRVSAAKTTISYFVHYTRFEDCQGIYPAI